jgi:polyisoprenoid-binding protein YceI
MLVMELVLAALVSQATAYRIDPAASEAGFDLKATMHTVHGSTQGVTGEVRVEPGVSGALTLSGKVEIRAASIETGNDKRDATMHSKSLLVESFPVLLFEPERFTPSGPAAADGSLSGSLSGRFTLRGKTKPQTISATLTPKGSRIVASGTFDVAWAEFGVPDPSFFVVRIADTAHARFRAEFVPQP